MQPPDVFARLDRIEQAIERLSAIMIDLATTNDKLEDQLLRFIASQREINTRQDAINASQEAMNARLEATVEAIKEMLRGRNGAP